MVYKTLFRSTNIGIALYTEKIVNACMIRCTVYFQLSMFLFFRFLIFTSRLVALIVLHAAGAGLASPTVLVTRPIAFNMEWLPSDNQTLYSLKEGERRK